MREQIEALLYTVMQEIQHAESEGLNGRRDMWVDDKHMAVANALESIAASLREILFEEDDSDF